VAAYIVDVMFRQLAGHALVAVGLVVGPGCEASGGGPFALEQQGIIGGQASELGEFPATGALVQGWTYRCTATMIAPDVILTAAHCLDDTGFGDFAFTLDADLSDGHDDLVKVTFRHQHPDYRASGKPQTTGQVNDLGVAILERPIHEAPVEIIHTTNLGPDMIPGDVLKMCGYGLNVWHERGSGGVKRDADVMVDNVGTWELSTVPSDPQPCMGDSGAPLIRQTPGGRRITGIVNRSVGGAYKCDNGAIASRIAPYADWIEEASHDRDPGCAVAAGTRSSSPVLLVVLAGLVALRAGSRRDRRRS
jgi:secreted trypsin-like serine protease